MVCSLQLSERKSLTSGGSRLGLLLTSSRALEAHSRELSGITSAVPMLRCPGLDPVRKQDPQSVG